MKLITFSILFVLTVLASSSTVFCQNAGQLIDKANLEYNSGNYYGASLYFEEALGLLPNNSSIKFKLALSYMRTNMYDEAIPLFSSLVDNNFYDYPLAVFHLGQMLQYSGKYKEAMVKFKLFYKYFGNNPDNTKLANAHIAACDFAIKHKTISDTTIIKLPKPINTFFNELSIIEVDDSNLIYCSLLPDKDTINYRSHIKFTKHVFFFESLIDIINKHQHNVADLSFSPDYKEAFFSSCIDSSGSYNCVIYRSFFDSNTWSEPYPLPSPINIQGYSNTQPSPSIINGKRYLFFSSNRPYGAGKYDLWYSQYNVNKFSTPINLGNYINSPGDDVCPFYDSISRTLFFSSDWHKGYGGFDIFFSNGGLNNWSSPVNCSRPVNSSYNETYFSTNKSKTKAYFSSNRNYVVVDGKKTFMNDFYSFKIVNNLKDSTPASFSKDSCGSPAATHITYVNKIKSYFPLYLYFDHDQPTDNNSKNYDSLTLEYKKKHLLMILNNTLNDSLRDFEYFFETEIESNFKKTNESLSYVNELLKAGKRVTITLKAHTSASGNERHNISLAKRREKSIIDYILTFEHGLLSPYYDGLLFLDILPPSIQTMSNQNLNYSPNNYSVQNSSERKVLIDIIINE